MGMGTYTKSKLPVRLVYFEVYKTRTAAPAREKEIKNKKAGNI
jgi:predicted GIY-YIG superfamily endonuclease